MHQQRPLMSPGLLLLSWLLLLTVSEVLTNTRPAGKVAYRQLRLPPGKVDIELLQVDGTCVCRQACFATTCRCYTLVQMAAGGLDCIISRDEVNKEKMVADTNATTICYSDYLPFGERLYRIIPALTPNEGLKQCKADGAQMAVIDTDQKMTELVHAMRLADVKEVWVALMFRYFDHKTRWMVDNGKVEVFTEFEWSHHYTLYYHWFTLAITDTGTSFVNRHRVSERLFLACQKNY